MVLPTLLRRLSAVLLAALVVFTGLSFEQSLFTCSYDGVTRPKCCCPARAYVPAPAEARLERAPCCGVDVVAYAAPSSAAAEPAVSLVAPSWVLVSATTLAPRLLLATHVAPRARRLLLRPGSTAGPPIFLQHCALLI